MMKKLYFLFLLIGSLNSGQITKNVYFIGNSYTGENNLPQLISNIAGSAGDNLIFQSYTPGGSTLQSHAGNPVVLNTISQGNWDYVVLQEQSQIPAFSTSFVQTEFFPFAAQLANNIRNNNHCGNVIFYMTWGRKNGDTQNCTPGSYLCTYEGMDDMLYERYMQAASDNESIVSPVGRVWRYIRTQYPALELYESDESHPSYLGSMIAAYTFYTVIFKRDPTTVTFNGNLSSADADIVRNAVKTVVYNNMDTWYVNINDAHTRFNYQIINVNTVQFTNQSSGATTFQWDFGDGTVSNIENPLHTYNEGTYDVKLTTNACGQLTTKIKKINITTLGTAEISKPDVKIYPVPAKDILKIKTDKKISGIEIFDSNGKKINCRTVFKNDEYWISIHELTSGIYFITYTMNGIIYSEKFIKE
jgi:PKD repeat protein